ncbi:MAG: acyltransferase [Ignavibacteriaceae bacterium]|nr:MAG: acetyltransferase [Chlorobi bacterium OLB4]MBV6398540.1 2,3,4,5-tetrahydropyridine-2,6-dicarboxylate N-acetyltransferase [Ignavibacteria bacterium]MEB2329186.1 acyltransferase [Ignavibacteriaceae bacterium]OQY78024.1 MAG: hypothetical protein B6D43_05785 [Ignavibacteriales bacterium UTCHB1]
MLRLLFRIYYGSRIRFFSIIGTLFFKVILKAFGAKFGRNLKCDGFPIVRLKPDSNVIIGDNFRVHSSEDFNIIGRFHRTGIVTGHNASLIIRDNVGISASTIVCYKKIEIGNNVMIGGNCVIYDTDFHSIDNKMRRDPATNIAANFTKPVSIGDEVFIGAHSTILKGTVIGRGAVIGAGSVVTGNIPEFELWAGNPAKYIKKIP